MSLISPFFKDISSIRGDIVVFWGQLGFLQPENWSLLLVLCLFVRCLHTFFHDFELSKRDKQVKLSWHQVSLEDLVVFKWLELKKVKPG